MASQLWKAATRKKRIEDTPSKLERVLDLKDLVALGVGSTLGLGAYVLAGTVSKYEAGPAVCISFFIAALSAALSGTCFAEFAARVPKAGSTYVYCYASIGECIAFIIGWNMIFGIGLSIASVAKGLSGYIDSLFSKQIQHTLRDWMPLNNDLLSKYPDILALALIVLLTIILGSGVKESALLHAILTSLNLFTLCTAIIAVAIKADFRNWNIPLNEIDVKYRDKAGQGGFMPFGIAGVMSGMTKCFFSYVGFDSPAVTGGEAKNPQRDIPLAILISIIIITFVYIGISVGLTLACPYYEQDEDAPFAYIFKQYGWSTVQWLITFGAIFALSATMIGCVFFLPRVLYAMAEDGLIFKCFSKVDKRTRTPLVATVFTGIISGPIGAFINIDPIIDMMTAEGLIAYAVMGISVIVSRFRVEENIGSKFPIYEKDQLIFQRRSYLSQLFNIENIKSPTHTTSNIVKYSIMLFNIFSIIFCVTLNNGFNDSNMWLGISIMMFCFLIMVTLQAIIFRQPQNDVKLHFKVPLVPFIPSLSIFFNIYLMTLLSTNTWIGMSIWIFIGLTIYFFYGVFHSEENPKNRKNKTELTPYSSTSNIQH